MDWTGSWDKRKGQAERIGTGKGREDRHRERQTNAKKVQAEGTGRGDFAKPTVLAIA